MSREDENGFVCPKCDTVIYRGECRCTRPDMTNEPDELTDALGTDLLQAYLAAAYSVYLTSTRDLHTPQCGQLPYLARERVLGNKDWAS